MTFYERLAKDKEVKKIGHYVWQMRTFVSKSRGLKGVTVKVPLVAGNVTENVTTTDALTPLLRGMQCTVASRKLQIP